MKQLLEAGVHFGHQTRRWNPKMAEYIFTERNGIYIIDLQKTVKMIEEAYYFTRDVAAEGGSVLFVGTKKQAQEAIKEEAERTGMYYVMQDGSAVCSQTLRLLKRESADCSSLTRWLRTELWNFFLRRKLSS